MVDASGHDGRRNQGESMKKEQRKTLIVGREVVRQLRTRELVELNGAAINGSDDGHVCESVNACPGSVAPYPCATDICQTYSPPCNNSAVGPCV